jgi:hypothetical protein
MDELKIVPDRLVVVDKYVADYPMDEPKNELDKQIIGDHHVKETIVSSVNLLNCVTITVDNNADIPFKSKRLRKTPITRTDDFYGNTKINKLRQGIKPPDFFSKY